MKRLMSISLLLLILLALPQVTCAAPLADNGTAEPTAAPAAEPAVTPTPESTDESSADTTDALSEALGTLAVYAAIIAALAAGTEVITDLLRPFFGLERQPQVMEAFEQMKEWLPQTLKEMGADPQAQAQLQGYLNDLDSTVKDFKEYASGKKIAEVVQRWALGAIKSGSAQLDAKLKELETELKKDSKLSQDKIDEIKGKVQERAKAILAALESGEEMLQKLRDLLTKLNLQPNQVESAVGKALELMNTVVEDEKLKQELRTHLAGLGVPAAKIDEAVEEASKLLKSLKGAPGVQGVIKLASSLDSFDSLLKAVEAQRGDVISSFRKWWRALRDWKGFGLTRLIPDKELWKEVRKRSVPGVLLYYLEQAWNWLRDSLFSSAEGKEGLSTLLTPENAAQAILALDRQHYLTEARRQRLLRFTTVFIGIALAITLRIDSLQLLKPIMKDNLPTVLYAEEADKETGQPQGFLTLEVIIGELVDAQEGDTMTEELGDAQESDSDDWGIKDLPGLVRWAFTWMIVATPGMLLSGLAASAGSSFWHDQLDRLRATKKVTEQVKTVVGQVQGTQNDRS